MLALVTNDDGIDSPGLRTLAMVAEDAGLDVVVAAPNQEHSGTSASLAGIQSGGRLLIRRTVWPDLPDVRAYAVQATPAYITWAGIRGAFGAPPDVVLSGVNKGPNTGNAVLHSGTVGAALTASAQGVPAMAVSISAAEPRHWDTAAAVSARVLKLLLEHGPEPLVLNVNVPDVPIADLSGIVQAPLATVGAVQADVAEVGEDFVSLTFTEVDVSAEPHTDAGLQTFGWATITPLKAPYEAPGFRLDGTLSLKP